MFTENRELTAAEAADRLGLSHGHTTQLMRDGVLGARQLRSGDWLTSQEALDACIASMHRGRGRALNPESAWGVLWELSGLRPSWLAPSTLSRLRLQIDRWSAEDIVHAVSGRTRETRYLSAERSASAGLALTGRPVATQVKSGVKSWPDVVCGYVREGTVSEHANRHEMPADYEGRHALYEWTLPIRFEGDRMPDAVIAADLARSQRSDERAGGLRALARLKREWAQQR